MNETYLYPYSAKEARERNELSLWRESHRANIACRDRVPLFLRLLFYRLSSYLPAFLLASAAATKMHGWRKTMTVIPFSESFSER